jgi:hypothetical protein
MNGTGGRSGVLTDRTPLRRMTRGLLRFNGELGTMPLVPAALERIQVRKAFVRQLLCRPGTSSFVGSRTVEDQHFVLGIFVDQGQDIGRLDTDRPCDF